MCEIKDCNVLEMGYTILNKNSERVFKRNVFINCNDYFKFIKDNTYIDTYRSAYLYSSQNINEAELYGSLYLDFDDANNFNNAREDVIHTLSFFKIVYQIPSDQIKIYFSGHKGFHVIVPKEILGIQPDKNLNGIFKTIAEQVKSYSTHKTVDLKIYDNKRLFRVPNTSHGTTNLYKIIISPDELKDLSEKQIKELAKQPRNDYNVSQPIFNSVANNQYLQAKKNFEKSIKNINNRAKNYRKTKTLKVTPPCITNILENGAEEGSRNITIACLTSFYKDSGKSLDETTDLIMQWNDRNVKPTPYREMRATIKSIFNSDKSYGCSTLKTITKCEESKCTLKNNNRRINNYGIKSS